VGESTSLYHVIARVTRLPASVNHTFVRSSSLY